MSTATNRRLIEDWLPIKEISVEAVREGGALARHPPVNQLHVRWPLAVSRAAVAAALLNADADRGRFVQAIGSTDTVVDERRRMDEIKATGEWSNVAFSNKRAFTHNLTAAERGWFRDNLAGADPVGGGGRYRRGRQHPLRGRALGPAQHRQRAESRRHPHPAGRLRMAAAIRPRPQPRLRRGQRQVPGASSPTHRRQRSLPAGTASIRIKKRNFQPKNLTVRLHKYVWAYLWSRTVACPDCGNLISLSPNWRLDGGGKGVRLLSDSARGVCDFEVVNTAREQSRGTVARGIATCPYPGCGATTAGGYPASEAGDGRMGHQTYGVVLKNQWQRADGEGGWVNIRKPKDQPAVPPREFRAPSRGRQFRPHRRPAGRKQGPVGRR